MLAVLGPYVGSPGPLLKPRGPKYLKNIATLKISLFLGWERDFLGWDPDLRPRGVLGNSWTFSWQS